MEVTMPDMLVRLHDLTRRYVERTEAAGVSFSRAEPGDATPLREFVVEHFTVRWADGIHVSRVVVPDSKRRIRRPP